MRGTIEKIDYIGFTYKTYHTSQFGLKSVSNGSRYTRNLLPTSDEYTTDVIGGDGTYFFGSKLTNRSFNFDLAFDDVTEQELREITRWLYNNGEISTLIMDELPFIQYYVRVKDILQMKYLAFENDYGVRIYKGELSVEFTAYDPYGYAPYKWLSNYTNDNIGEWSIASRLLASNTKNGAAYYDTYAAGNIPLYNPGDVATDFVLTMTMATSGSPVNVVVTLGINTFTLYSATVPANTQIRVDTKKRLITTTTNAWVSYTVVNSKLTNGNFFQIPVSIETITPLTMTITNVTAATITYPYKFL